MILDILDNAPRYLALNKGFAKAFEFLRQPDLANLPEVKHTIDGDRVFAIVSKSPGRNKQDAMLEAHEKYIDIQFVVAGTDDMGWRPRATCTQPDADYDPENDVQFFKDEPDAWISTKMGAFVILFPDDPHMPMISSDAVHKIVVKVAVDQG